MYRNCRTSQYSEDIYSEMYTACPQKRHRLNSNHRNGFAMTVSCRYPFPSKRKQPQNLIPSHDERFLWGMSETSIVRWMLGICCLFLLFPGTYNQSECKILNIGT